MNLGSDMRIPVVFADGAETDAYLIEGDGAAPPAAYAQHFTVTSVRGGHPAGCGCCLPRGPAAAALAALFHARATGIAPLFKRVVVSASAAGEMAVRDAMQDVVVAARYRI